MESAIKNGKLKLKKLTLHGMSSDVKQRKI